MSNIARTALRGVTYYNPFKAYDGYTLFLAPDMGPILIDIEGNIVHSWQAPLQAHCRLLPNGLLSGWIHQDFPSPDMGFEPEGGHVGFWPERSAFDATGDNIIVEIDWDGNIVWQTRAPYQTHDTFPLDIAPGDKWSQKDKGHYLYPAYHPDGIFPDSLAKKWQGGVPGTEYKGKVWGDIIYEVDRDGKIVWEWKTRDHLDPVLDAFPPLDMRANFHSNTISPCRDGTILWSGRVLCQIHKIAYPSGEVVGRYGKGELFHQHDCKELSNGNILTLDNGSHRSNFYGPEYSRSVEIDPKTGKVVWEYTADPPSNFYTSVMAGSDRLPNGNTLISDAYNGRLFEVTREKELVWEYVVPMWNQRSGGTTNMVYRVHRYSKDHPAFKGKDLDPARWKWENLTYGPPAWKNREFKPCIF